MQLTRRRTMQAGLTQLATSITALILLLTSAASAQSADADDTDAPPRPALDFALLQTDDETDATDAADVTPDALQTHGDVAQANVADPFAKNTWTFQFYGSGTAFDDDHGHISTAHVGVGYHLIDDVSVNLEGIAGWVDSQTDDDGAVAGFDLLFRWHALHDADYDWTLYADGGAGFQLATTDFPSDSQHNFRPQIGGGATLRIDDNLRLMAGARWLHASNAGTSDNNDGGDWLQYYLGAMLTF